MADATNRCDEELFRSAGRGSKAERGPRFRVGLQGDCFRREDSRIVFLTFVSVWSDDWDADRWRERLSRYVTTRGINHHLVGSHRVNTKQESGGTLFHHLKLDVEFHDPAVLTAVHGRRWGDRLEGRRRIR